MLGIFLINFVFNLVTVEWSFIESQEEKEKVVVLHLKIERDLAAVGSLKYSFNQILHGFLVSGGAKFLKLVLSLTFQVSFPLQ